MKFQTISVVLSGLVDILFDRFIDHSSERRPPEQKLYLGSDNLVVLPGNNITSFLFGNQSGCAKAFEGKKAKDYLRIGQSHVFLNSPMIPFLDEAGQELRFDKFGDKFWILTESAVTRKGSLCIKQEAKDRPVIKRPWQLAFEMCLIENPIISENKLYNWLVMGGMQIGLGSYRPRFGRFEVKEWSIKE